MRKSLQKAARVLAMSAVIISAQAGAQTLEPITNRYGSIIPEQGVYTELTAFTLQMTDAFSSYTIERAGFTDRIVLNNEETGETVTTCSVTPGTGKCTLTLAEPVTAPGHYLLVIPENAIGYEDDGWGFEDIQPMSFRFWVEDNSLKPISNTFVQSIDPEQGVYTELEKFTITFTRGYASDYIYGTFSSKINLINEDTNEVVTGATIQGGTGKVTLTLKEKVTAAGHYILDVAANALGYDNDWDEFEDVPAMKFRYWIEAVELPAEKFEPIENRFGTVAPEQGTVSSIQNVTLTLPGYASDYVYANNLKKVTLVDEATNETVATFSVKGGTGAVTLSLPESYTTNGHYIINIPDDALGYDNDWDEWESVPAMQYRYWVDVLSGVAQVEALPMECSDVYSITGVCVGRGLTLSDVRHLPAGIYVFAGRKIAVK